VIHQNGFIVGYELRKKGNTKEGQKDPQRPVSSLITCELIEASLSEWGHLCIVSTGLRLARLEIYSWIYEDIDQIAHQMHEKTNQSEHIDIAKHNRVVPFNYRVIN